MSESTNKILKDILDAKEGTADGISTNSIVRGIAAADDVTVPNNAKSTNSVLKAIAESLEEAET